MTCWTSSPPSPSVRGGYGIFPSKFYKPQNITPHRSKVMIQGGLKPLFSPLDHELRPMIHVHLCFRASKRRGRRSLPTRSYSEQTDEIRVALRLHFQWPLARVGKTFANILLICQYFLIIPKLTLSRKLITWGS